MPGTNNINRELEKCTLWFASAQTGFEICNALLDEVTSSFWTPIWYSKLFGQQKVQTQ